MEQKPRIQQYILLPTDPEVIAQLRAKLKEYLSRKDGKGKPWEFAHPTFAHTFPGFRAAYYKAYVLEEVLSAISKGSQQLDAWQMFRALINKRGMNFSVDDFNNACGVIDCYCGNMSPEELKGGTGLPVAVVQ